MSCLLAGLLGVWGRGGTPTPARRQVSTFGVLGVKLGDVSLSLSISLSLFRQGYGIGVLPPILSLSLSFSFSCTVRESALAHPLRLRAVVSGSAQWKQHH